MNYKIFFKFEILFGLCLFVLGLILGKIIFTKSNLIPKAHVIRQGSSKFINPLLECDLADNSFSELEPFQKKIQVFADLYKKQNSEISSLAVYFRDLNNGPWFGIDEQEMFSPASLLKTPLMIAYFKLSEKDPTVLQKTILYSGNENFPKITKNIHSEVNLVAGQSYTVEKLIKHMIVYSDNQAYFLLFSNININDLINIYKDFGISLDINNSESIVNVKNYASFFRILFNASYLNQTNSEKALEFLSESEFKDGLVAGVPNNIIVSHKFGERELEGKNLDQIHDCGVIYYPNHPYLLCVMTKGSTPQKLIKAIYEVSSLVYKQVDSQMSQ